MGVRTQYLWAGGWHRSQYLRGRGGSDLQTIRVSDVVCRYFRIFHRSSTTSSLWSTSLRRPRVGNVVLPCSVMRVQSDAKKSCTVVPNRRGSPKDLLFSQIPKEK